MPALTMDSDLAAVAAAYRRSREAGEGEFKARTEAERVYCERHPDAGPGMSRMVAILIHEASLNGMLWPRRS